MWKPLKMPQKRSKSLEIARNRSNLASADVTLRLRLGFWPVKSGQCYNVLPIVSVVGPNYQFQLLPTLSSMFSESLIGDTLRRARDGRRPIRDPSATSCDGLATHPTDLRRLPRNLPDGGVTWPGAFAQMSARFHPRYAGGRVGGG